MTQTSTETLDMTQPDRAEFQSSDDQVEAPVEMAAPLTLGDRLREARTEAGLTLEIAAGRTRINKAYLEALEDMDPRGLPSRAYCVGYLRTYAGFLGLDAAACVDQFKLELEVDTGRGTPTAPQEVREIKLPRGMVGTVVILVGIIAVGTWYADIVSRSDAAMVTSESALDALLTPQAPLVDEAVLSHPEPTSIWAGLPGNDTNGGLILEAAESVTIEIRDASGRILADRTLDPGGVYRAPDEAGLTISATNAGAVLVRSGTRALGPLGEPGEVVDKVSAAEFVIAAMREDEG